MKASPERTGWRCEDISRRHREWGFNCPAVDLDFLMAEYNYSKPVALVEYKEARCADPNLQHPTYRTLANLADGYVEGSLPFVIAFYEPIAWWFRVLPVNDAARDHWRHCANEILTEQRFVRGLYLLRKKVLDAADEAVLRRLNQHLPAEPEWEDRG